MNFLYLRQGKIMIRPSFYHKIDLICFLSRYNCDKVKLT